MGRCMIARSTMLLREGRNNYKQMLHHTLHHDELIHGVPNKDQNNNSNNDNNNNNKNNKNGAKCSAESALWVPDPRTGIYYPKGYEWVMEDVPQGASSFPQPYWLRSGEVVERPTPTSTSTSTSTSSKSASSHSSDEAFFDHPFLNL